MNVNDELDDALRQLTAVLEANEHEYSAVQTLGRYASQAYTLTSFEIDAVNKVCSPQDDLSQSFVDYFVNKMIERANDIVDSLED